MTSEATCPTCGQPTAMVPDVLEGDGSGRALPPYLPMSPGQRLAYGVLANRTGESEPQGGKTVTAGPKIDTAPPPDDPAIIQSRIGLV